MIYIFSILGEIVYREHKENQVTGYFKVEFNGYDLANGSYFYKLRA